MKQKIAKFLKIFSSILVGLAALLAVLLVGVRIFGLQVYTVLSGSMEPVYHTGSVIYVAKADPEKLEEGDVITFRISGSTLATHRIIEVVEDGGERAFRTKGDANDVADGSLVSDSAIVGRPVFTIPYLGYFASFIQNPPGKYLAIAIGSLILLIVLLSDFLDDSKKKDDSAGETPEENSEE